MQLYCDQERLAAALKAVLPAVPSRPLVVTDADNRPGGPAGRDAGGRGSR
jgi:hypothetical protein